MNFSITCITCGWQMAPDCDGTCCHCATHIQYCSTPFFFTTLGVLFDYVVKCKNVMRRQLQRMSPLISLLLISRCQRVEFISVTLLSSHESTPAYAAAMYKAFL